MSDVVLSAGIRQNLLALQDTARLMSITQNRLATGKKVNSALDNPVNFFTSSGLQTRAGDLQSLLDAMSNGVKTIEAADNGLTAIMHTIESMQSTLLQARQDQSFKTKSYPIGTVSTAAVQNLSFSGGSVGTTPVNVALNTADTTPAIRSSVVASADYTAPTAATAGTNSFAYAADATAFGATDTVTFDINVDGGGAQTITLDQATVQAVGNNDSTIDDIGELTAAINGALATAGVAGVTATNDGTNVTFTSATTGANSSVAISAATPDADGANAANTLYGLANNNGVATAGQAAVDRAITIAAGGHTANITLTAVNAGTAAAARAYITAQLAAQGVTGVTVGNSSGANHIDLTGLADGTNTVTVGGADVDNVFGAGRTATAGAAGSGDGVVKTVDQLVNDINTNASLKGRVNVSNDSGVLRVENLSTGGLTLTGVDGSGNIDGSAGTATIGGNDVRTNLVTQFNQLRDQLDKFADDASYNGVNLLRGDNLKIVFNETATSTINIQAKDQNGNVTAINAVTLNISSLQPSDLDSATSIDGLLSNLSQTLNMVRAQSSDFGSNLSIVENRTDFTKAMVNTLQTGADALVLADTNEEGANMLALQTRQQLSTTALSLSAQAAQAVLRLFG